MNAITPLSASQDVACIGSMEAVFEIAFGRRPRVQTEIDRLLADIRFARRTHTDLNAIRRAFPIAAPRITQAMAAHRRTVADAALRIRNLLEDTL